MHGFEKTPSKFSLHCICNDYDEINLKSISNAMNTKSSYI